MARIHDPADRPWRFLVSTNRGLEAIASAELAELGLDGCEKLYPGMVACAGPPAAIPRLNTRARTIHRVLLELARGECHSLAEIATLVEQVTLPRYLAPDRSVAVRAQRRGDHPFGSPDVEARVGQAIVDSYERTERPPVDLDEPDVVVRVFVREDLVVVTVDTTGQRSLHRRQRRVVEHEAPIRPTMAAAMSRLAAPQPGDVVVDPMCGCGTIPLEIAAAELGRPVAADCERAFERLRLPEVEDFESTASHCERRDVTIVGGDIDPAAVAGARTNAQSAGLAGELPFVVANARTAWVDADIVLADLPFGHRTGGDVRPLYAEFVDRLTASSCRRAVLHTTRANLLDVEPSQRFEMRRGRLESELLVVDY